MKKKWLNRKEKRKWIAKRSFNKSRHEFLPKGKFNWRWQNELPSKKPLSRSKNKTQRPWKFAWPKKESLVNKKHLRKPERK